MKKLRLILTLLFLMLIIQNLLSQERYVSISDSIKISQQINLHFGENYKIDDLIFVDSLEIHYDRNRSAIDDEYGTLDGCIVFAASKYEKFRSAKRIIGVYKDNQIIWYSDNIDDVDIIGDGFLEMIEDINNDGKVEIITVWKSEGGASYHTKTLYVHTWDGNNGNLIVDMPKNGSRIGCHELNTFDFIDVNGDGKWEIISYPSVFEWNGNKYVLSESMKLDSINIFFPRNNFNPVVVAWVEKFNEEFKFGYNVKNLSSSAQSINQSINLMFTVLI